MKRFFIVNLVSIFLLIYYFGGFFVFVFHNSRRISTHEVSQDQLYFSPLPGPWDFSFLDEADESSVKRCTPDYLKGFSPEFVRALGCDRTPHSSLRVSYDKLPLDEKIEARLADFFKAVADLLGRNFWAFPGMHIFLAFFALVPLVALVGVPLLWRLLCRAWGRRQVMAERPIYRGVVGVFALVILVLLVAVVGVAMMERPEGEKGGLSEAAIEAHEEMVRNLLN